LAKQKERHERPVVLRNVQGTLGYAFWTLDEEVQCGIFTKYETVGIQSSVRKWQPAYVVLPGVNCYFFTLLCTRIRWRACEPLIAGSTSRVSSTIGG
jgi:hypothetical protein